MIISNKEELLQEIDNLLGLKAHKTIERIIFLCPNMNASLITHDNQSPQNLGQEILKKLQQTRNNTTIHSFEALSQEQILGTKQPYSLPKHITLKTYCNHDTIIKTLLDSIKESAKINTANQYENLEAMLNDIKSENIDKISLKKAKDAVIEHIGELPIESNLFAEMMKADAKVNIEQLFNKLEQYIKQAIEDKNKDYYKNIIKTIFNVILAIATGGGAVIILLGISAVLLSSLMDSQDAQNNKYSYIKNPIIEFLATELAMYIQLANTQLLSCMLIVESTQETDKKKIEFLDLSGFNLYLENTLLSCSQSIALKGELMLDSPMIDIPNLLAQKAITLPKTQHNSIKAQMLYIHQNKTKQQNIKDVSLLTHMLQAVQYFNHLAYIESPHFNSALLAEICADKNAQYPNNHTTNMAKNYLIITNAPSKYNAKLTETITQHIIGNTIKDDMNNRTKQELTLSRGGKNKSYNTTRDYSTYRIEINKKDDEAYMVQLSPFVRAELDTIKQAYENNSRYKDLNTSLSDAHIMDAYSWQFDSLYSQDAASFKQTIQEDIDALVRTYGIKYIQSFFKTPKEIEDIIKKEEQTAKDFLTQLQYFHDDNENLDNSLLAIFTLFYGLYVFKIHFPSFVLKSSIAKKTTSSGYLFTNERDYLKVSCLNETWEFYLTKAYPDYKVQPPQNIQIAKVLQEKLLQHSSPQETELSKDFLAYLKEFMDTDIASSDAKAFDDEIKKEIGIDKELEQELAQIKNYGEKYAKIVEQERTQEVCYNSFFKILGIICPFMNFAHENMIDATKHCLVIFINAIEHLNKTQNLKLALHETLLTEIGGVLFLSYPTTIRVHIEIDGGVQDTSKKLNNKVDITNKIKAKLTESLKQKNKEQIQNFLKGFAQVELRRTKAQIAHFEAKTAFILDSIDKDTKTLKLTAIKEKLKQTMSSPKDKALIDKICFTYGSGKAQSHLIGELQAREVFSQVKQFYRNKVFYTLKINSSAALAGIALDIVLEYYFSTNYEAYAREYDSIMHKRYTFYYDLPYALKRVESLLELDAQNQAIKKDRELTYYPMLVHSKFMSFDLQSMIYGTELCTGGLTHHIGLAYLLQQNKSNVLQEFLLTKLLAYLIIDEKRRAKDKQDYETHYNKQVPDYTFFHHKSVDSKGIITNTTSHISLNDIRKYQVPEESSLYQEFKKRERKGEASAIDAYNEALEILADYKDYFFTNTPKKNDQGKILSYKDDKNKARRLLECLNTIGQNNIKALYVGVNDEKPNNDNNYTPPPLLTDADSKEEKEQSQEDKKRPKFIGRLATTIIIEDGLWLG
ncbi:hypothetical protein LS66_007735 [Helicobacter sp. MIT 03-1614]|uniref:Uncharacterized protein n=2 Tax=Helicobacter bilis TaxID=37372 RepID=A0A6D2C3I1_9HELI|nr:MULTISPECIES: hypothetical protein [Helicobacter]EMZ35903.1 hypothetical protein C826_02429 [Helicobacter bilis WiWa]TLD87766.1 hypothetical protein LS66_007735 [Helicobacter sp. MIT 03-1614]TLE02412.1 hypothetical protein LS77_010650 [Helicobacter bilis]